MFFFNACAQLRNEEALKLGKQVLSQFFNEFNQKNVKSIALYGAFNMFIKCDDIKSAEILFNKLNKNVICYGSLMKIYNDKNEPEKTLNLFKQMKQTKIEPNQIIFLLIINACAQIADLSNCESILLQVPNSCLNDIWIRNALIDMWVSNIVIEIIR
jgi:pentatricopeptide repeat protein